MDRLLEFKQEIKRQHNIIDKYKNHWIDEMSHEKDINKVRKWLYEFQVFFTFHLYMEEYFIDISNKNGLEHIKEHRNFLVQMYSAYFTDDIYEIINKIFIDYLVIHFEIFDDNIEYVARKDANDYFNPDMFHGGFIIVYFKSGYHAIGFGNVTAEIIEYHQDMLLNYLDDFEEGWTKFVDIRKWEYATEGAFNSAKRLNQIEEDKDRLGAHFLVRPEKINKFIIGKFFKEGADTDITSSFEEFIKKNDFKCLVESDIIAISVEASKNYISKHFSGL